MGDKCESARQCFRRIHSVLCTYNWKPYRTLIACAKRLASYNSPDHTHIRHFAALIALSFFLAAIAFWAINQRPRHVVWELSDAFVEEHSRRLGLHPQSFCEGDGIEKSRIAIDQEARCLLVDDRLCLCPNSLKKPQWVTVGFGLASLEQAWKMLEVVHRPVQHDPREIHF